MKELFPERRKYTRVAFESVIKYSFCDAIDDAEWRIGRSIDVSVGGLKFESVEIPRVTCEGKRVAIRFIRANSEICFYAEIKWCLDKRYGVQFRDAYTDLISEESGLCVVNM